MSDSSNFWSDEEREIDELAGDFAGDLSGDLSGDLQRDSAPDDDDASVRKSDADDRTVELDLDGDAYAELDFMDDDRY